MIRTDVAGTSPSASARQILMARFSGACPQEHPRGVLHARHGSHPVIADAGRGFYAPFKRTASVFTPIRASTPSASAARFRGLGSSSTRTGSISTTRTGSCRWASPAVCANAPIASSGRFPPFAIRCGSTKTCAAYRFTRRSAQKPRKTEPELYDRRPHAAPCAPQARRRSIRTISAMSRRSIGPSKEPALTLPPRSTHKPRPNDLALTLPPRSTHKPRPRAGQLRPLTVCRHLTPDEGEPAVQAP